MLLELKRRRGAASVKFCGTAFHDTAAPQYLYTDLQTADYTGVDFEYRYTPTE